MAAERRNGVPRAGRKVKWTALALLGALAALLVMIAYFATGRSADQDKLLASRPGTSRVEARAPSPEKRCSSPDTYDLIKHHLFDRAAQLRGSDQAAYAQLASFAVVRMENPVMESEEPGGAVNCSGSLSLDLPPGVATLSGRHSLKADIDYTIDTAGAVTLRNADSIVTPLATLAQVAARVQPQAPAEANGVMSEPLGANAAASIQGNVTTKPSAVRRGVPSVECARTRTKADPATCADTGLAVLDHNLALQDARAFNSATAEQKEMIESTGMRFRTYRARCLNRQCIAEADIRRMREIRAIMAGRWRAPE